MGAGRLGTGKIEAELTISEPESNSMWSSSPSPSGERWRRRENKAFRRRTSEINGPERSRPDTSQEKAFRRSSDNRSKTGDDNRARRGKPRELKQVATDADRDGKALLEALGPDWDETPAHLRRIYLYVATLPWREKKALHKELLR